MAASLAHYLLLFQIVILIFFFLINAIYTVSLVIAFIGIRNRLAGATRQHIKSLVSGIFYRPITIVVPAFNEAETIVTTVSLLLQLRYPEFEVVVVNDGSSDQTMAKLKEAFRLVEIQLPRSSQLPHQALRGEYLSLQHENLAVIDKETGGKADALNAGINVSRFPLFCSVDADSVLESDALLRAAKLFVEDRETIATGGIVRVLNGCTLQDGQIAEVRAPRRAMECYQAVEYCRGFLTGRTSWDSMQSLLIISGAFGIFRKDLVLAINGYRKTVGEDMDLVVRLHRHCREQKLPYKIHFVPDPVCWTQVPDDYRSLLKQRNRWQRGLLESLWFNKKMLFNPRYGSVGLFAMPYFLIFEALGPAIEFLGYLSFIVFYFQGFLNREYAMLFLVLALLWGMWLNIGAITLDNLIFRRYRSLSDLLKLSLFGLLEFAGYRQIIVVERLLALFSFRSRAWDKTARQEIRNEKTKRTF